MKNIIEFYYNISFPELHKKNSYYFFKLNNNNFVFIPYFDNINRIKDIYKLASYLSGMIKLDNIILNRYNSPITIVNDENYILITNNINKKAQLSDISIISQIPLFNLSPPITSLERKNWEILWENKIDYFEQQVGENAKRYPLIRESFDYFVGLGENAIAYLVNTKRELKPTQTDKMVISHVSLTNSLYNPLNIIIDHKARDLAEYIKLSFFNKNYNIFKELDIYFHYNHYSEYGIRVLYARILYPSFYFDAYDKIVSGQSEEKILNEIINIAANYELYLNNIYLYLKRFYNLPDVGWIKKKGTNPHSQL